MKSQIIGMMLAGSLATAQGIENNTVASEVIPPVTTSKQVQQFQKDRVATTLQASSSSKMPILGLSGEHEVGDLFMELIPESEYGNLKREKVALGSILKALIQWESRLGHGFDEAKKGDLRKSILELGEQYYSMESTAFNRNQFEDLTYSALLRIVTTVDVESLQKLREKLQAYGSVKLDDGVAPKNKSTLKKQVTQKSKETNNYASEENLMMYKSLYLAEKIYLQSYPQLLATCGAKYPQREDLRTSAILLIDRIVMTAPMSAQDSNTPEHDLFRDRLNQIRKKLYASGEMGYAEAQKWGFEEQERRNKSTESKRL